MKSSKEKPKVCLACSAGGHLVEMRQLKEFYSKYPHFFITFKRIDSVDVAKEERVFFVTDPGNNPINFLKCVLQTIPVLFKEKPDVVISTGAGVTVPTCYLSKLFFRSKIIYLESFCQISGRSLSGRLLYPVVDLLLVQWPEMLRQYGGKAKYWGAVF